MDTFSLKIAFSCLIAFLITFYLVPVMCAIAKKLGIIDKPDGKIKKHKDPTPYLGGIAVYGGFITALAIIFPFENRMFFFLVGTTYLLFLGLIDDLLAFKSYQKFFGQIIATICFLKGGLFLKTSFLTSNMWRIPISFLWILVVINAFNLVDVMDGLATTLAICATTTFLILSISSGQGSISLLLAAFLGSLLAFLWYNKPQAKIFLGDTGSLFIGGFLATVPFFFNWGLYNPWAFIIPVIILAIPLLEVVFLIAIRTFKGIPFYNASPDHFSIYLQKKGWDRKKILGYVTTLSIALGIASYAFMFSLISPYQLLLTGIIFLFLWFYILLCNER